jgi:hypothetical protein
LGEAFVGTGVLGQATAAGIGVRGVTAMSTTGVGVLGESLQVSGSPTGVQGLVRNGTTGNAVRGIHENTGAGGIGVYGSHAGNGLGVLGEGLLYGVRGVSNATGTDASIGVEGIAHTTQGIGVKGFNDSPEAGYGVLGLTSSNNGVGVKGEVCCHAGGANVGVQGQTGSPTGFGIAGINTHPDGTAAYFNVGTIGGGSGNIIVGQSNGINRFRVNAAGKGFFNGGTEVGGADFAESVAVTEEKSGYEPGDVMTIDGALRRTMTRSTTPYSTMVAGIYSTKPGIVATPYGMDDPRVFSEIPLAIVGIVPCKVTAENGPIETGDLLVTSSTPGHAMKGTDRARMLGAIVGKALEPLKEGTGVIQVLVTLQ